MDAVISVVVVDAVYGRPAEGVVLRLESVGCKEGRSVCCGYTGDDGIWTGVVTTASPTAPRRLVCEPGGYFAALGLRATAEISVMVVLPARVTITLAPFGHTVMQIAPG